MVFDQMAFDQKVYMTKQAIVPSGNVESIQSNAEVFLLSLFRKLRRFIKAKIFYHHSRTV
jgi:hypothetical protein